MSSLLQKIVISTRIKKLLKPFKMIASGDQEAGIVERKNWFFKVSLVPIFGVLEGLKIYHLSSILIPNKLRSKEKRVADRRETITIIINKS